MKPNCLFLATFSFLALFSRAKQLCILIGHETIREVKLTNRSMNSTSLFDLDEVAMFADSQNEEMLCTVLLNLITDWDCICATFFPVK